MAGHSRSLTRTRPTKFVFVFPFVFALSLWPLQWFGGWVLVWPLLIDPHGAKHTRTWVMATFAAQITHTPRLPRTHSISTLILLSCVQSMQFVPSVSIEPSADAWDADTRGVTWDHLTRGFMVVHWPIVLPGDTFLNRFFKKLYT